VAKSGDSARSEATHRLQHPSRVSPLPDSVARGLVRSCDVSRSFARRVRVARVTSDSG